MNTIYISGRAPFTVSKLLGISTFHGMPLRYSEQGKQRRQKKAKRRQMAKATSA